jgi:arylsulfatase
VLVRQFVALELHDDNERHLHALAGRRDAGQQPSQANDLAANNPEKPKELQDVFDAEAKKYNVYLLDSRFSERFDPAIRPSLTRGRTVFT